MMSNDVRMMSNDVRVHFFIHSNNAVNYTSEFQEVFEDRLLF